MYLHIGGESVISENEIIGIFDIENTTISKETKNFLSNAEKNSQVRYVSSDMPKSFVLCRRKEKKAVYISPISASTLKKRNLEIQEFPLYR